MLPIITKTKRRARAANLSQFFLMGLLFSTLVSRFPALKELYGLSIAELGFIPFAMSAGSLIATPICVFLSAKYGSRKVGMFCYLQTLSLCLFVLMPEKYMLFGVAVLYGALMELSDIAMNANSIIVEQAYKRPILGMFHSFFYFGMALGAVISIVTMQIGLSVTVHYVVMSVVAFIWFAINHVYYLKETPAKSAANQKFKILLPRGVLLLIAFVAFCGRIVEGSISDWSTVYMKNVISLEENFSPIGLMVYSLFIASGRLFSDTIRRRFTENQILLGCGIITSAGIAVMICGVNAFAAIAGLFISGIGLSCFVPVIYSLAGNRKDVNPGLGIAMVNTISGTGFLFGPSVIGFIAEHYSLRVSFAYVLLISLIMTALIIILKKHNEQAILV